MYACLFANGQGLPESALSKLQAEDNPDWKVAWDKQTAAAKRLFNATSKAFPGKPQDAARVFDFISWPLWIVSLISII